MHTNGKDQTQKYKSTNIPLLMSIVAMEAQRIFHDALFSKIE